MKIAKNVLIIFLFAVLCIIFYTEAYASNIRLIIDNQEISGLPSPPIIRNDSVLVPARAVFERMGGVVGWHSGNRQVTVFHGDNVLVMTIDDRTAILNGAPVIMPVPPVIVNDSTMIPLRFPGEAFGFGVYWDRENRAAILNSPLPPFFELPAEEPPTEELPIEEPPTEEPPTEEPPAEEPPTEEPPIEEPPLGNPEEDYTHNIPDDKLEHLFDRHIPIPPPDSNIARNVSSVPILPESHPQTSITQVLSPSEVGMGAYVIVASSPITEVNYFVLPDNRLVIDIHNAVNKISGVIAAHHSVPVSGVRVAQFSNVPMVTRIVFDVTQAAEFTLTLSANRESLTVAFAANNISSIVFQTDGSSDSLHIQGDVVPYIRITTEGFPNFITINIDNAEMTAAGALDANGVFVTHFETGQRADGSSYVNVFVGDNWPTFSVHQNLNTVSLMFHHNLTGLRYDSLRRELHISRDTGFTMDINLLQHIDEYLQLRYSIVLPNSASMLGRGELGVMDGFINTVTLQQDALGSTRLVFDTARVLAFTVHETPEAYIIRAHLPREVHPFIVVIDPGHGGTNIGSAHHGVVERYLVLTLSQKVSQLLESNPNIRIYKTRHDDSSVCNFMRAEFANEIGADLFISVHANAAVYANRPQTVNPTPHGIETWYNLGEREVLNFNRFNSRQFAAIIQQHMIARTSANCRGERYGAGLVVLRESNMPSVLIEVGFLTNPAEAARLATSQHQWQLAYAIYDAIVEAANTFSR